MCDLMISADDLSDLMKYNKIEIIDEFIANARKTVLSGHKVIIRGIYKNAPPQDLQVFTTIADIDAWLEDIDLIEDINAIKPL
jgi:hypothetical protein